MFKSSSNKGERTRTRVLEGALQLFRDNGFDRTGMREIAAQAGLSLGAAYHYFDSKEAIVFAYFEDVQREHERRVLTELPAATTLQARLRVAFHTKLDIVRDDRRLLSALVRYGADPEHPLSFLGSHTRAVRSHSIAIFAEALGDEKLPDDVRAGAPTMLWAAHMGILLYFVNDGSAESERTRRLTDGVIDLAVRALALTRIPVIRGLRKRFISVLEDAGMSPPLTEIEAVRAAWRAESLAGAES